jgi:predicted dienelactone hydrolase
LQWVEASSRGSVWEQQRTLEAVGVQTIEYQDARRHRPVVVELWYPVGSAHDEEKEGRNEPLLKKKAPLILMSHGHRNNRLHQDWLAKELAKEGYIVAAVDHYGSTQETFKALLSLKFWERARDISFALDRLLEQFPEAIDSGRIGFVGYSMGGMTGLALAGAQAKGIREKALKECRANQGLTEEVVSQIDFSDGEKSHAEPRIRAFLLLSPANFVYPAESIQQIQKPIGVVAALHDEVLPHKEHAAPLVRNLLHKKYKLIREKVNHAAIGRCQGLVEDGEKLQREILQFTSDFFHHHL